MPVSDNAVLFSCIVTLILAIAILAVGLRLHVRVSLLKNPGKDDWLCLAALCCGLGTYLANMAGVAVGFGDSLLDMTPENRTTTLKTIWISPPLWGLSSSLIKMSIITSYLRIWSDRPFKLLCHILLAILTLFGLSLFFGGVFACVPISLSWTPPSPTSRSASQCINLPLFMFITSTVNTALDLVIFAIPVPLVHRLQIAARQKVALTGVFTIGAVVCVASVMRLVSIYELDTTTDPSEGGIRLGLWSGIESNLAITCACLPTLRPVIARVFPRLLLSATSHSAPSWGRRSAGVSAGGSRRWTRRETGTYRVPELQTDEFSRYDDRKLGHEDIEMGAIRVNSSFRVDVESVGAPTPAHVDRHDHTSYMDLS
ncbi:uncharacterized protein GGS22DRAFT_139567 [Annulohypoxylon maeteangense]|uniref:uncharacterized protein n=1 Tax=Annulohypoxylon maeteangense TaxID=1927788 RepID=UPI00200799AA|nr:uncharacterized protein GGS22DRAFT_139567 [Annulohypoxylon maeteangense]KAI0885154.1 hypothetical protein GGS22DRAFT_139567 [Annulohypoxylon maeteangense]